MLQYYDIGHCLHYAKLAESDVNSIIVSNLMCEKNWLMNKVGNEIGNRNIGFYSIVHQNIRYTS